MSDVGGSGEIRRSMVLKTALGLAGLLVAVSLGPGRSDAKPKQTCRIPGGPLLIVSDCSVGNFNVYYRGDLWRDYMFTPGAGLRIAIYDDSGGWHIWGDDSDGSSGFENVSQPTRSGRGTSEHPYRLTFAFTAGKPDPILKVTNVIRYVKGEGSFLFSYTVENVSDASQSFRMTTLADLDTNLGAPAYGELDDVSPRYVGSYTPASGEKRSPCDGCEDQDWRGRAAGVFEVASSPWSAFQEGAADKVRANVEDAGGPGLDDTFQSHAVDDFVAVQWDDFGMGHDALEPGDKHEFTIGWRFADDLLLSPYFVDSCGPRQKLLLDTRYGRSGPIPHARIEWIRSESFSGPTKHGSVTTDASGRATISFKQRGSESYVSAFIDANENGKWDAHSEVFRGSAVISWMGEFC
jgi:hypothetical protein